LIVIFTW
jgi:hypothetical protein